MFCINQILRIEKWITP